MKLIKKCKQCGAAKHVLRELVHPQFNRLQQQDGNLTHFQNLKCNHTEVFETGPRSFAESFTSLTGTKSAYDYQQTGVQFIIDSDFNALIADDMGLGKTIQAQLAIRNSNFKHCLTVVKSATTFQWVRENYEWLDNSPLGVFPIIGTNAFIPPGFKNYIISMDTLGRNGTWKKLLHLGIDVIIVDECHSFKDPSSSRTKALLNLIEAGNIEHKILLSGTPIKNRASEYFVSLNMLAPDLFPSLDGFKRRWLLAEKRGPQTVYNRLNPARIDAFNELIAPYVLRRDKKQVQKDLPPLRRLEQWISIDDPKFKEAYNLQLDEMARKDAEGGLKNSVSILGELAKLRRVIGHAKATLAVDYVEEFLENTESDEKIAVGIQHQGVRDILYLMLEKYKPLKLSGENNAYAKDEIVQKFALPENRVLILNELAGGVGLNLQFCSTTLLVERQWNAADEEQFESRFHRNGQTQSVSATYLIAKGTIDEWFHWMVQEKRQIFGETIQQWKLTDDFNSLRDLVEKSLRNRL